MIPNIIYAIKCKDGFQNNAIGMTTGAPEVRPSRSSRTIPVPLVGELSRDVLNPARVPL